MRVRGQAHVVRADEILSDGEWHDGAGFMREIEKVIPPGPAHRAAERRRAARRAYSAATRQIEVPQDQEPRELDMSRSVITGRRLMVRTLIHSRARHQAWEMDPWPLPDRAWQASEWRVRDLRTNRVAVSVLSKEIYHVSPATLRKLVLTEPALLHVSVGVVVYVDKSALDDLQVRVKEWQAGTSGRRSAGNRNRPKKCAHCQQPVGDNVIYKERRLCHPQSGMDCYLLVKFHDHPFRCDTCIAMAEG